MAKILLRDRPDPVEIKKLTPGEGLKAHGGPYGGFSGWTGSGDVVVEAHTGFSGYVGAADSAVSVSGWSGYSQSAITSADTQSSINFADNDGTYLNITDRVVSTVNLTFSKSFIDNLLSSWITEEGCTAREYIKERLSE